MSKQIVEMSLEELQAHATGLEAERDNLVAKLNDAETKAATLQQTIDASAEPELRDLVKSQEQELADLKLKLAAAAGNDLKKKSQSVKPAIPAEPVEVDGEKWQFRFPAFYFEGVRYTAEEAAVQADLLKKIVGLKGQSILKKVI